VNEGDAVRVNSPGNKAHGLIGHIVMVTDRGDFWVAIKEFDAIWIYAEKDLVVVQPLF
jgi:hypothetical protein